MKVVICTPTISRPHESYLKSLEDSIPALDAAGIEHSAVFEVGNPYISAARAVMLQKALIHGIDAVVFIDHDLSWRPQDLVKLILTPGDVVAGMYRYKKDKEQYMGSIHDDPEDHRPVLRDDGCIDSYRIPAGFLKITKQGIDMFRAAYPELEINQGGLDLFNHGVHKGVWYGEDMAFSRRWHDEMGQKIWVIPDLQLDHHSGDQVFPGNLHKYLMEQPGAAQ